MLVQKEGQLSNHVTHVSSSIVLAFTVFFTFFQGLPRQAVRSVIAFTWAWVNITPKAESQVFNSGRGSCVATSTVQPRRVAFFHNFFLPTNNIAQRHEG
jgi:hypothetical protein